MGAFQSGDNPADHNVAEVVEYLAGDVSPEEKDRVLQAEREGKNRVGIMSGSGVEAPAAAEQYGEDDPASLGPDKLMTEEEAAAHAATVAALEAAQAESAVVESPVTEYGTAILDDKGNEVGRRYTPEEALKAAVAGANAFRESDQ